MSHTILVVALEFLAVGLFTLLAGASNDAGSIMVMFMIGLWVIYLVTDSSVISGLANAVGTVENNG